MKRVFCKLQEEPVVVCVKHCDAGSKAAANILDVDRSILEVPEGVGGKKGMWSQDLIDLLRGETAVCIATVYCEGCRGNCGW
jgi:hypothetical protein